MAIKSSKNAWSEDKIQMYVATEALRAGYLFHADGNGNYVNGSTASRKKLMGSRAGWPDMVFILNGGFIVWIELKTAKGIVSKVQEAVHNKMRQLGCEVHVVKAKDGPEAWEQICRILNQ